MSQTRGLIKLDQVVYSYLNELGENSTAQFNRYKQIVIEGFTDMNIHVTNVVEQQIAEVNTANQITLNPDYIAWASVYVEVNGRYWPLDHNENIVLPKEDNCGTVFYFSEHLINPSKIGYEYTERRHNMGGRFAVNEKTRIMRFEGDMRGKSIYIIYLSSGVNMERDTYINRALLPTLKAYLNWIITIRDKTANLQAKDHAEYLYGLELQKYDVHVNSFTAHDFLSAIRAGYTLGVKR